MTARSSDKASWWVWATDEQRLRQLDAGIELGMTGRQIALASGTRMYPTSGGNGATTLVHAFAGRHGRKLPGVGSSSTGTRNHRRKLSAAAAYYRGEPIDLWAEAPRVAAHKLDQEPAELVLE